MADVKKAGYFSFSVDSTPDISHTDQLTLIIRYVSPVNGLPSKRFITFLELKDHSGVGMADLVHKYLTSVLSFSLILINSEGSLMTTLQIWLVGTRYAAKNPRNK